MRQIDPHTINLSLAETPKFVKRLMKYFVVSFFALPLLMLFLPWVQNIQGKGTVVAFLPNERKQNVDARQSTA